MRRFLLRLTIGATVLIVLALGLFYWKPVDVVRALAHVWLRAYGFESKHFEVDGQRIHYYVKGSGESVIFIHGLLDSASTWRSPMRRLADRYRVIAYDNIGHGYSAKPVDSRLYQMEMYRRVLRALLDHEKVVKPTLVGNSLGGWIALSFAMHEPEKIKSAVLVDLGGDRNYFLETFGSVESARQNFFPKDEPSAQIFFQKIFYRRMRFPGFFLRDRLKHMRATQTQAILDGMIAQDAYVPDEVKTPVPLHVVWGTGDALIPIQYGRALATKAPHADLHEIPNCGHAPQLECAGAFRAELEKALAGK